MFRHYVAIGNSLSEGLGDPLGGARLGGWASHLAGMLQIGAPAMRFTNLAVRGHTTPPCPGDRHPASPWCCPRCPDLTACSLTLPPLRGALRRRIVVANEFIRDAADRHHAVLLDAWADPRTRLHAMWSLGLARHDIPVRHFVLHAAPETLRQRIEDDTELLGAAAFRLHHLESYAEAARTWLFADAEVVDTTDLSADEVAVRIATAVTG